MFSDHTGRNSFLKMKYFPPKDVFPSSPSRMCGITERREDIFRSASNFCRKLYSNKLYSITPTLIWSQQLTASWHTPTLCGLLKVIPTLSWKSLTEVEVDEAGWVKVGTTKGKLQHFITKKDSWNTLNIINQCSSIHGIFQLFWS